MAGNSDSARAAADMSSQEQSTAQGASSNDFQGVATIVVGMAGAGKTTFMQRLTSHLSRRRQKPYILNLDPAVLSVPYPVNIDIRDTINYKEVMKQYQLGPNGGILTSLNLFTTRFDQVLQLLDKRAAEQKMTHVLIDTPGQIEIFTWSASGAIMTDSLASSFPTVLTYIIDSPRSTSCSTFISSMLYAVSILYKTKLPMIIVFNKTDVQDCQLQVSWMRDFEAFQEALRKEEAAPGSGYMTSLMHSMSLMLEEFYNHLDVVGVSALTGEGFDEYEAILQRKRAEYQAEYKPELEALRQDRDRRREEAKREQVEKLMRDRNPLTGDVKQSKRARGSDMKLSNVEHLSDDEDVAPYGQTVSDAEAEDEDDGELIEPDEDENFESVEAMPGDANWQAARQDSAKEGVEQLVELMGGISSLKQARNM